ncbi:hypothetical protein FQR65_LT16194 [Abscondita terminalis]|nr:hypothetical protein FQR65_LT16194 [Abscondita terminalis]
MPKKGIPLSRQKSSRSRSNRAKKIKASWIERRKTRPQEIHTMNEILANELETEVSQPNEPPISEKRIVNIASLLQSVIKVSENHARTCITGSLLILANELETEVSQPNEPPISEKRIVNIASLLQSVIKVSENHARTCITGSLLY